MARLTDDAEYDAGKTSGNVPRPRSYSGNDDAYSGLVPVLPSTFYGPYVSFYHFASEIVSQLFNSASRHAANLVDRLIVDADRSLAQQSFKIISALLDLEFSWTSSRVKNQPSTPLSQPLQFIRALLEDGLLGVKLSTYTSKDLNQETCLETLDHSVGPKKSDNEEAFFGIPDRLPRLLALARCSAGLGACFGLIDRSLRLLSRWNTGIGLTHLAHSEHCNVSEGHGPEVEPNIFAITAAAGGMETTTNTLFSVDGVLLWMALQLAQRQTKLQQSRVLAGQAKLAAGILYEK
ncbi:unnamed protein product [Protopolystoma xenopodis]|uniref:Uncharacterized protein n=1 Tax=Protopolystoma xenopodis TaxID=117903 RepID=A0A3S5C4F5_9PLAT|nr:unnamed protein product [Protopolystoma xenopodis]